MFSGSREREARSDPGDDKEKGKQEAPIHEQRSEATVRMKGNSLRQE